MRLFAASTLSVGIRWHHIPCVQPCYPGRTTPGEEHNTHVFLMGRIDPTHQGLSLPFSQDSPIKNVILLRFPKVRKPFLHLICFETEIRRESIRTCSLLKSKHYPQASTAQIRVPTRGVPAARWQPGSLSLGRRLSKTLVYNQSKIFL